MFSYPESAIFCFLNKDNQMYLYFYFIFFCRQYRYVGTSFMCVGTETGSEGQCVRGTGSERIRAESMESEREALLVGGESAPSSPTLLPTTTTTPLAETSTPLTALPGVSDCILQISSGSTECMGGGGAG